MRASADAGAVSESAQARRAWTPRSKATERLTKGNLDGCRYLQERAADGVADDWKQVAAAMSDGTGSATNDSRITKGFFEREFLPIIWRVPGRESAQSPGLFLSRRGYSEPEGGQGAGSPHSMTSASSPNTRAQRTTSCGSDTRTVNRISSGPVCSMFRLSRHTFSRM